MQYTTKISLSSSQVYYEYIWLYIILIIASKNFWYDKNSSKTKLFFAFLNVQILRNILIVAPRQASFVFYESLGGCLRRP
jgi:hypothetical protein